MSSFSALLFSLFFTGVKTLEKFVKYSKKKNTLNWNWKTKNLREYWFYLQTISPRKFFIISTHFRFVFRVQSQKICHKIWTKSDKWFIYFYSRGKFFRSFIVTCRLLVIFTCTCIRQNYPRISLLCLSFSQTWRQLFLLPWNHLKQ